MCVEHRKSKRRMLLREKASNRAQANYGCKRVRHAAIRFFADTKGHGRECVLLVDISELDLKKGTSINFPEGKDKLMHFEIKIKPEEGTYRSL